MDSELKSAIVSGLGDGSVIPYIGPAALSGIVGRESGEPIPADS